MEKIDIHSHYFPPSYNQMLERRGMTLLDGGFPKPEWKITKMTIIMIQKDH